MDAHVPRFGEISGGKSEHKMLPHTGPQVFLVGEKVGAGAEIRAAPIIDNLLGLFYVLSEPRIKTKQPLGKGNQPERAFFIRGFFGALFDVF